MKQEKEYLNMFRILNEDVHKMFSIKRKDILTRSMIDNDDAIFAAIREEFTSPQLILGNCYFHLAHRSKSLKATWVKKDGITKANLQPMLENLNIIQVMVINNYISS